MNPIKLLHKYASPQIFYRLSGRVLPWIFGIFAILTISGLYFGLYDSPIDYQQKDTVRIMYIHVPAAWMSLFIYIVMAICAVFSIVWKTKISHMLLNSSLTCGAAFTFIALVTGSLWGKPTWGTYWVWDARLTSELILLFIYLGIIALRDAIENKQTAIAAVNIMTLVGVVNIPIIHYSVVWWNSLHQGSSIKITSAESSIAPEMLLPLLLMAFAFKVFYVWIMLLKTRTELLKSEKKSAWVQEICK